MSNQDSIESIYKVFNNIFKSNDPFEKMFHKHISARILLYRTGGNCYLTQRQLRALRKTINVFGESTCYLAAVEGGFFEFDYPPKEININISYEDYKKYSSPLDNVLFSKNGTWGVIISIEDHAVIGGSDEFIKTFKSFYHNWDKNINSFIEDWESIKKENSKCDLTWLPEFLDYIDPDKLFHK